MEKTFKAIKISCNKTPSISFSDKNEYKDFLKEIPDGAELLITVSSKRTLDQNRLFHKLVSLCSEEMAISFDAAKVWLVCKFFGCNEVVIENSTYTIPVSTSTLNKKEFALGLTNLIIFATEELSIQLEDKYNILTQLNKQK